MNIFSLFPYKRCQNDKITINDNIQLPYVKCGSEKTDLLYQSCSNQISISIQTGSSSSILYKGSKLYYESMNCEKIIWVNQTFISEINILVVDKDSTQLCPAITTATTTTTEFLPQYVIDGKNLTFELFQTNTNSSLGISSPTNPIAFCRNGILDILNPNKINCPSSYVIVIRRSFYGITRNNVCSYT